MRADGHSRESVIKAIWRYAPEWRSDEKRDWRRYAARTAAYAFGFAGDEELAKLPRLERKLEEVPPPPVESVLMEQEPDQVAFHERSQDISSILTSYNKKTRLAS